MTGTAHNPTGTLIFAANVRRLREAKGWSQGELARRVGRTQAAVSHWEAADRRPAWATLLNLAGVFGCEIFELTTLVQAPSPPLIASDR